MTSAMGRNAVIVHAELSPGAQPDETDVLVQAGAVARALEDLGYRAVTVPFGLDLKHLASKLLELEPCIVFNLVEGLDGDGRLIHLACSILDHLGFPYTGADTGPCSSPRTRSSPRNGWGVLASPPRSGSSRAEPRAQGLSSPGNTS